MGRTVDELLDSCSYRELVRWGKFAAQDPFGEWRADLRIAQLVALTANIHRDEKKRKEPFSYRDFMPFDQVQQVEAKSDDEPPPEPSSGARIDPTLMQYLFAVSRSKKGKDKPDG
jgi:hypothetical protein